VISPDFDSTFIITKARRTLDCVLSYLAIILHKVLPGYSGFEEVFVQSAGSPVIRHPWTTFPASFVPMQQRYEELLLVSEANANASDMDMMSDDDDL
jgi:hypothetical protein